MSEKDNGYRIIPLADLPLRSGRRKGGSVWQPAIDKALANSGHAVEILLSEHPELARIPSRQRSSHFGGMARRLGIAGRSHLRATPNAIYIWIDPPASQPAEENA